MAFFNNVSVCELAKSCQVDNLFFSKIFLNKENSLIKRLQNVNILLNDVT